MAWMLATIQTPRSATGARQLRWRNARVEFSGGREPGFFDTLAAAYAEIGQFPDAVQLARQAVDLARRQEKPAPAVAVRARLRLYEAGTPFRQTRH